MSNIIDIVRGLIGTRHQISKAEMQQILMALPIDLVNASTIGGRSAEGKLHVGGKWIENAAEEREAVARAWAKMCTGITCISVVRTGYYVGDELVEGLGVRYDDPGSMHPLHRAELIFAPAELGTHEYDQIGQLRRKAERVLVVRD